MEALASFSESLADVVESTGRSVIRVEARRGFPASGVAWSADGLIVTADHVVERNEEIRVAATDGEASPAALVGRDPGTDVAVLRSQATGLVLPAWADLESSRVGQIVLALARPGRTVRARMGIISALGDKWRTHAGGEIDRYLEPELGRAVGFSGGPLVNVRGQVLGLNTRGLQRRGFVTVPVATLRRVVDALLTYGHVRRGYLGVSAHPVRLSPGAPAQAGQEVGLIVVGVEPGSPAEQAGLLLGDTMLTIGHRAVQSVQDLRVALDAQPIGTAVTIRILRAGRLEEVTGVIGERGRKTA